MPIYVEPQNKLWLAKELRLWPQRLGIDLADDRYAIEMKSCWQKYRPKFTIHEYQIGQYEEDNPGKELFWAFLHYDARATKSGWRVRDRDAWIVPWEFAHTLEPHTTPREEYRYVNRTEFPYEFTTPERPGGTLHLPQGCPLKQRLEGKRYLLKTV